MLSTIRRTTVVFPDPDPPATPMTSRGPPVRPARSPVSLDIPRGVTVAQDFSPRPQDGPAAAGNNGEEYQDTRPPADNRTRRPMEFLLFGLLALVVPFVLPIA